MTLATLFGDWQWLRRRARDKERHSHNLRAAFLALIENIIKVIKEALVYDRIETAKLSRGRIVQSFISLPQCAKAGDGLQRSPSLTHYVASLFGSI